MKNRFKITMVFEGDLDMIPGWGYTPQSWIDLAKVSFERQSHYNTSAYVTDIQIDGIPAAAHEDAFTARRRRPIEERVRTDRPRVKITRWGFDGIEYNTDTNPLEEYNFYWWNILPKDLRYFGFMQLYSDGTINTFGWWFGNISWRSPWTRPFKDLFKLA